jgi:hypothetical protein
MYSFDEPFRRLRKACAEGDDIVPLCFVFPFFVLVFPRLLRSDAELYDGCAVREVLGFCVLANKSDDRKLIQVHIVTPSFCPVCLGTQKQRRLLPNQASAF